MAAPLTTSFRIGIFGTMRVTFDQNVNLAVDPTNKGTFVDAGGNEFNTANASITSGTTVEATIVAGGAVNPTSNGTCALASGFATLVLTPFTANAPTANNAFSYTGIVSAVLNKAALTLTIVTARISTLFQPDSISVTAFDGTKYNTLDFNSASPANETTPGTTFILNIILSSFAPANPGCMTFQTSGILVLALDSTNSIPFSNYPIIENGSRSRSRNFRGR